MPGSGIINFIWSHRTNRIILLTDLTILVLALIIKLFLWNKLTFIPFIFFGIFIPIGLLWINILPYSFHSEWLKIVNEFTGKLALKRNVKIYIKNFWPWTELVKIKNTFRAFQIPHYDFDTADILESDEIIIIYGKRSELFGAIGNTRMTRPFGISLNGGKFEESELYLVDLISKTESKEFNELTIVDHLYGKKEPITIRIYKNKQ